MPDENGKLNDVEWDKVAEWIRTHAPKMQCHLCGNHDIHVGDQLVSPVPIKGTAELVSAPLLRLVALTCRKCQSVSFVNVGGVIELPTS